MKNTINLFILSCFACLLLHAKPSFAQDYAKDFKAASHYFQSAKLNYHFSAKIYADHKSSVPGDVISGKVQKLGDAYRMQYEDVTTLVNEDIYLLIDKTAREMYVSHNEVNINQQFSFDSTLFTHMLDQYDSIRMVHNGKHSVSYAVYNSNSYIPTSIIKLARSDKRLLSLTYHYSESAGVSYEKVVVDFTYKDPALLRESDFRTSNYLVIDKENMQPATRYASYQLKHIHRE